MQSGASPAPSLRWPQRQRPSHLSDRIRRQDMAARPRRAFDLRDNFRPAAAAPNTPNSEAEVIAMAGRCDRSPTASSTSPVPCSNPAPPSTRPQPLKNPLDKRWGVPSFADGLATRTNRPTLGRSRYGRDARRATIPKARWTRQFNPRPTLGRSTASRPPYKFARAPF